jgi:hypothetical protein
LLNFEHIFKKKIFRDLHLSGEFRIGTTNEWIGFFQNRLELPKINQISLKTGTFLFF